jgi:membrane-associated protease RseP (regulator of RpoE activity)
MVWQIVAALIFFALILVSVGLHELGHFVPSKLFGVKVRQFFIGFGKNLWKTQRGETEYGVKILPLGGYVSLVGMVPPRREGKNTWLKRLADSAREGEWEEITEADVQSGRLFYQRPIWQRLIIMASGVAMNLLVAFVLFQTVNLTYGQYQQTMTIDEVITCLDPAAPTCQPTPAAAAGLAPGDTIVSFNGTTFADWPSLSTALRGNVDQTTDPATGRVTWVARPVSLIVDRPAAGRLTLPTVPGALRQVVDPANADQTLAIGYLGVVVGTEQVRLGPGDTLAQMGTMVTQSVKAILRLPVSTYEAVIDLATGAPRDEEGPISVIGAARVAGEVAATNAPVSSKLAVYISLLGSINLFVAILNLVPLLPFDGGHIAAGLWEAVRRVGAKALGRPDPGPVDSAKLLPIAWVVGGLLAVIGVILVVADIFNPVRLF